MSCLNICFCHRKERDWIVLRQTSRNEDTELYHNKIESDEWKVKTRETNEDALFQLALFPELQRLKNQMFNVKSAKFPVLH